MSEQHYVSIKGRQRVLPSLKVSPDVVVVVNGRFLKVARVHDEFWLKSSDLPDPSTTIDMMRKNSYHADLFTFAQKFPDITPRYSYHLEWDNLAVAKFSDYMDWYKQINQGARYSIKKAMREHVTTEVVPFTDELVQGIWSIYNETSVRQGKYFWHYGKPLSVVRDENSTYLDHSVFLGAFFNSELIGFIKLVVDPQAAHLMQIISKTAHFNKCPANALLSKAVEVCATRGIKYLTYSEYDYGKEASSTLTAFKQHNGFKKVDVPRYFIPLSLRGAIALKLGIHRGLRPLIPRAVWSIAAKARKWWYELSSSHRKTTIK